jgi:hypothetical protein
VTRAPTHAGKLPGWERLVFGLLFALMATFVVAVTVSTVRSGPQRVPGPAGLPDSMLTPGAARSGAQPVIAGGIGDGGSRPLRASTSLDKRLAAALRPETRTGQGRLAVGVIDLANGAEAVYGAGRQFRSAGLATADILATLLLRNQGAGRRLTPGEAQLAVPVMESGDAGAATRLWRLGGPRAAMIAANGRLGLADTTVGTARSWGLAKTTVADQLRLLADLTSAGSPLTAASRDYELGLMAAAQPGLRWGACAAASPGTACAVSDGWLADPTRWVTNSIAVVDHLGRQLLIAVLSDGHRTRAAGIADISAAARAAAQVMTTEPA